MVVMAEEDVSGASYLFTVIAVIGAESEPCRAISMDTY